MGGTGQVVMIGKTWMDWRDSRFGDFKTPMNAQVCVHVL